MFIIACEKEYSPYLPALYHQSYDQMYCLFLQLFNMLLVTVIIAKLHYVLTWSYRYLNACIGNTRM